MYSHARKAEWRTAVHQGAAAAEDVIEFWQRNCTIIDVALAATIMEQPLEKKSGVCFGPPGARRLVYFIDDMNMPFVDKYDTQVCSSSFLFHDLS